MNKKIFVSAYACEPGLGSEIGVGWHWVLEMSRYFELWVLTRRSNKENIESWIAQNPEYAGIHFLYFDLPRWARFWKKGLRGVRTYYNLWQLFTGRIVRRTMQDNDIHVFHHITYGNVMWPVSNYGSKQTFIWGPVGGLETIPADFTASFDRKQRLREKIRGLLVTVTRMSPGFRRRCRRADLIFAKTDYTRQGIPARYRDKALLFTDVAPDSAPDFRQSTASPVTRFIVVGRLEAWRGFDIAIEALKATGRTDVHLTIVGKGPDKARLRNIVARNGMSALVTFVGKLPIDEYYEQLADSDVVVNPSLKEGAVTVSFDAMSLGKPLIALDTTGYTRYFEKEYSRIIPAMTRHQAISDMAEAMNELTDASLRSRMGEAACQAASRFSWKRHGEEIRDAIEKAIENADR